MKLYPIHAGNFKLDGGAMFGVVPKSLWQKINPPDELNLCNWAMRCLLVEEGDRLILIDSGIGNKQSEKFFSHYYLNGGQSIDGSLKANGFTKDDITDVFLTHLHFDHCGGAIVRKGEKLAPAFKNATYWSNESHWAWATQPNDREKASFLKENILPIRESGQLKFVSPTNNPLANFFEILVVSGHTDSMMLPKIQYKNRTVIFMADLLPSAGHIPIPYVMAYDTQPLLTLQEKKDFLQEALEQNYVLFFEHDPQVECCTLQLTERGIRSGETFNLAEL